MALRPEPCCTCPRPDTRETSVAPHVPTLSPNRETHHDNRRLPLLSRMRGLQGAAATERRGLLRLLLLRQRGVPAHSARWWQSGLRCNAMKRRAAATAMQRRWEKPARSERIHVSTTARSRTNHACAAQAHRMRRPDSSARSMRGGTTRHSFLAVRTFRRRDR